ncbi:MAG: hypothetical protein WBK26_11220 [Burkholderiaceae bacterium]
MSNASEILGGGSAGAPIGAMAAGKISDPAWLPLDGNLYNKADYPLLDTSRMLTFGSNNWVAGPAFANTAYNMLHLGGSNWYAANIGLANTTAYRSTDDGATWTAATLPANGNTLAVRFVNGVLFALVAGNGGSTIYTSTDLGVSWLARTVSSANYWGSVGYVGGRYILLPSYAPSASLIALWSTDLATWTAVTLGSTSGGAANTNFNLGYQGHKATWTRNTGFVVFLPAEVKAFQSVDGLVWRAFYPRAVADNATWLGIGPGSGMQQETENGDLRMQDYVITSGATNCAYKLNVSLAPITPLGQSNIVVGYNGEVSESHGATIVSMPSGITTIYEYAADISATSVCAVTHTGQVYRRLLDTAKFRAVAPAQSLLGNLATNQKLYIKAR